MDNNIKKELHRLIDTIENEHVLNILKEDAVAYLSQRDIPGELSPEQLQELNEAIPEADRGEGITPETFRKEMYSWRNR